MEPASRFGRRSSASGDGLAAVDLVAARVDLLSLVSCHGPVLGIRPPRIPSSPQANPLVLLVTAIPPPIPPRPPLPLRRAMARHPGDRRGTPNGSRPPLLPLAAVPPVGRDGHHSRRRGRGSGDGGGGGTSSLPLLPALLLHKRRLPLPSLPATVAAVVLTVLLVHREGWGGDRMARGGGGVATRLGNGRGGGGTGGAPPQLPLLETAAVAAAAATGGGSGRGGGGGSSMGATGGHAAVVMLGVPPSAAVPAAATVLSPVVAAVPPVAAALPPLPVPPARLPGAVAHVAAPPVASPPVPPPLPAAAVAPPRARLPRRAPMAVPPPLPAHQAVESAVSASAGASAATALLSPPPGLNTTRLAYAVTKLLTLFRMRSFGTHPTAAHAAWLPVAVGGLQFVTPAFGYTALDGAAALAAVNPLWAGMEVETVVVPDTAPPGAPPAPPAAYPHVDALLYWPRTTPTERRLRAVAAAARAGGVAYLLVGAHPRGPPGGGVAFQRGRWVGVPRVAAVAAERQKAGRDDAFVCGEGVRGVVPMVKGGGGQRYLVLYRVVDMKL